MDYTQKKAKLLYLTRILSEKTDDNHGLTLAEIQAELESYGLDAERKTLYADFEILNDFGFDVEKKVFGGTTRYHHIARDFELTELKLLVDAVQAARFISEKRSNELIGKLEKLTSEWNAKELKRSIHTNRVKTMNAGVLYSVDTLHRAINENRQVSFRYFSWTVKKTEEYRREGAYYQISPWRLAWSEENYYLIGFDEEKQEIRHFRVDKIKNLDICKDLKRHGKEAFKQEDLSRYTETLFSMSGGEIIPVQLECANELAGVFIDRFGRDIMLIPEGAEKFHVTINAALSTPFLGWVMSLSPKAKIIGPEPALDKVKALLQRQNEMYLE